MGFQNDKSPNFEIPELRVLGQNDIWMQAPCLGIENTIGGKVMVSPKSKP
jgi:hypothetical protein